MSFTLPDFTELDPPDDCPECGGSGVTEDGFVCEECEGTGFDLDLEEQAE